MSSINRRSFIYSILVAAAAANAKISMDEVSPQIIESLPDRLTVVLCLTDADRRPLTQPVPVHLRRTSPGHWSSVGAVTLNVTEVGAASYANITAFSKEFTVSIGKGGIEMNSTALTEGSLISIMNLAIIS